MTKTLNKLFKLEHIQIPFDAIFSLETQMLIDAQTRSKTATFLKSWTHLIELRSV